MKLTMGVYTDFAQLPMIAETARLPSLSLRHPDPRRGTFEQRGIVLSPNGAADNSPGRSPGLSYHAPWGRIRPGASAAMVSRFSRSDQEV